MSESKENIEARLAEYVEGTLDAAGRAEIERHLAQNDEHRRLIADLLGAKAALRALPRASAPRDMTEELQGQLERTALLGEGLDGGGSLRLNRWPQVMALAAIVILAVGLGIVVYVTLPSQTPTAFTVVEKEVPADRGVASPDGMASTAPVAPGAEPSKVAAKPGAADAEWDRLLGKTADTGTTVAGPVVAETGAGGMGGGGAFAGSKVQTVSKEALPFVLPAPVENDMVVVMNSGNFRVTDDRVQALFRDNKLNWERMDGVPVTDNADGKFGGDLKADPTVIAQVDEDQRQQPLPAEGQHETRARREGEIVTRDEGPGYAAKGAGSREMKGSGVASEKALNEPVTEAPRQSAPAAPPAGRSNVARQELAGQERAPAQASLEAQQQQAAEPRQQPLYNRNQYVVRGITRSEASQLLSSLSQDESLKDAQVYTDQPALAQLPESVMAQQLAMPRRTAANHQSPDQAQIADAIARQDRAKDVLRPGDEVAIEVKELEAPGVTPLVKQRVDERGNVKLQMIPTDVPAAGQTAEQLQQSVADRYRESNLVPSPTVRVTKLDATTQPVAGADGEFALKPPAEAPPAPAAQPAPNAAEEIVQHGPAAEQLGQAQQQGAQRPAAEVAPPSPTAGEELVDVVIVVQDPLAAGPVGGTVPTTQPLPPAASPLREGDSIVVTVVGVVAPDVETQMTRRIGANGSIALPLVGQVQVAGKTPSEATEAVVRSYSESKLLDNPQVDIVRVEGADPAAPDVAAQPADVPPAPLAPAPTEGK